MKVTDPLERFRHIETVITYLDYFALPEDFNFVVPTPPKKFYIQRRQKQVCWNFG
ncbi:hypothetical protein LEP1GSC178_1488 [Leptospira licerasiae str. MMD4847]|uniref:Uncharacterized protein n=1 Tax=Leptospira licerasiae str. MMD4847 TaxID=1049971 RepID=A0ABN0H4S2_9LEPT|nr:hypothetical protein LEP1GSC178_1488 [Leptospira licerasiae str. MMD4847]